MNLAEQAQNDHRVEGGAFHPDLPNGRASGEVLISFTTVQFRSDKGDFDLPADGLKIELGGANDRLIFFSHPTHPKVTIHTADHGILNHPMLVNNPAFTAQRKKVRAKKRIAWAVLLGVIGSVMALLLGLFLARDNMVRTAAKAIPVDWEIAAGEKLFEQIVATRRLVTDTNINAQLKQITDPLLAGIKDNRYPLKFHIVEDATLNAFAMPGGNVVIHSGLLMAADSPEEVAGVLGHEIAHVTQRHSIRSIISSAGLFLVIQTMVGDVSGIVAVLANNSAFLLDRKFSRDFERESDNHGWDYLLAANIKPEGMIVFFKKMEAEVKRLREKMKEATSIDIDPGALEVLSTHPATDERMKNLQAKWDKLAKKTGYRTFDLNYTAFKDSLRAKLHSAETETDQKDK
ncbi:MAG: M48 family metallopeptidase [Verrucomicrobiota bacterium]